MIQAHEIRIGNWINQDDDPIYIHSIDSGGISFCVINGVKCNKETGAEMGTGRDIYKPIPLTAEILEKAGAIIWGDNQAFTFKFGKQGELIIFPGTTPVAQANGVASTDFYYSHNGIIIIIRYLHVLQNLYLDMSGQELQVNLISSMSKS